MSQMSAISLRVNDSEQATRLCSCRRRRRRECSTRGYTKLQLFHRRDTMYNHYEDCPFSLAPQTTTAIGLRFSHRGFLLARTIQAMISITTGTEGFSIAPNLTFRAVVPNDAPAFVIIDSIREAVGIESDCVPLINQALQALLKLFRNGEALPTDVNENGEPLISVRAAQCPRITDS